MFKIGKVTLDSKLLGYQMRGMPSYIKFVCLVFDDDARDIARTFNQISILVSTDIEPNIINSCNKVVALCLCRGKRGCGAALHPGPEQVLGGWEQEGVCGRSPLSL